MKINIAIKVIVLALGICAAPPTFTGCAWFQPSTVAVGSDPVVVGAEQASKLAVAYTGEFLKWEWINRGTVGSGVTKIADDIRKEFPKSHTALREATKAYKASRSPENKASLDTAIATLNLLVGQVRLWLPAKEAEIAAKTAKNP
jgi:hypothetical protein